MSARLEGNFPFHWSSTPALGDSGPQGPRGLLNSDVAQRQTHSASHPPCRPPRAQKPKVKSPCTPVFSPVLPLAGGPAARASEVSGSFFRSSLRSGCGGAALGCAGSTCALRPAGLQQSPLPAGSGGAVSGVVSGEGAVVALGGCNSSCAGALAGLPFPHDPASLLTLCTVCCLRQGACPENRL